jgi:DnaK suppressor protein
MAALSGKDLGELAVALAERGAQLREEIRAKLGEAADSLLSTDRQWSDAGVAAAEADVEFAEAAREIAELAELRQAEARIDEGNYGECIACGAPIPLARLKAQPPALRCVACQEVFERGQAPR